MGRRWKRMALVGAIVFLGIGVWLSGCGDAESDQETSMSDVRKEAGEAAETVKDYAGQQQEKFMNKAKTALDEADQRISAFKEEMAAKWDDMDQQAREKARETLETMKEKRRALMEKLEELKKSSADAWEKLKKDLWDSYEALKESMESTEKKEIYI